MSSTGLDQLLDRHPRPAALLHGALAPLTPVSLASMAARDAELLTRVDRKYLLPCDLLPALMTGLDERFDVLQIDGRRVSAYTSTYFDSPDLSCFREHRQGRRRRFKVRTRTYLDSGDCWLEVKVKTAGGRTSKERRPYPAADTSWLTAEGREFVAEQLAERDACELDRLEPSLVVDYQRSTLVATDGKARVTIDSGLTATSLATSSPPTAGRARQVAASRGLLVVETKSANGMHAADRTMRSLGVRPQPMSKYCLATAALHPHLRPNPWLRAYRACFDSPQA
jgi:hypothetical protein